DFIIARHLLEGPFEVFRRILRITPEPFLERAHDPARRAAQAFARRVIPGPAEQYPNRVLRFVAGGTPFVELGTGHAAHPAFAHIRQLGHAEVSAIATS